MRRLPAAAICLVANGNGLWSNEDIADVWLTPSPKGLDFRPQKPDPLLAIFVPPQAHCGQPQVAAVCVPVGSRLPFSTLKN